MVFQDMCTCIAALACVFWGRLAGAVGGKHIHACSGGGPLHGNPRLGPGLQYDMHAATPNDHAGRGIHGRDQVGGAGVWGTHGYIMPCRAPALGPPNAHTCTCMPGALSGHKRHQTACCTFCQAVCSFPFRTAHHRHNSATQPDGGHEGIPFWQLSELHSSQIEFNRLPKLLVEQSCVLHGDGLLPKGPAKVPGPPSQRAKT